MLPAQQPTNLFHCYSAALIIKCALVTVTTLSKTVAYNLHRPNGCLLTIVVQLVKRRFQCSPA